MPDFEKDAEKIVAAVRKQYIQWTQGKPDLNDGEIVREVQEALQKTHQKAWDDASEAEVLPEIVEDIPPRQRVYEEGFEAGVEAYREAIAKLKEQT